MTLKFTLAADAPEAAAVPSIVLGIHEDRALTPAALRIDEKSGGAIRRLIESGDATGKTGSTTVLFGIAGVAAPRIVLVGLGEQKKLDAAAFHRAAGESARALKALPIDRAVSYLSEVDVPGRDAAWKLRTAALAADAQTYRYTATFKPKEKSKTPQIESIAFAGIAPDRAADRALAEAQAIANGVRFARELGNLPPNICNPAYIAAEAKKIADAHAGVTLEVLERDAMQKLGMGSLLGVSQGSANPPKLSSSRPHMCGRRCGFRSFSFSPSCAPSAGSHRSHGSA